MTIYSRLYLILALFILYTFSCTKPVLIGSDFLEEEKANLQFKDDFQLTCFTEKTDSVVVHSDNVTKQLVTYLCGNVQDPIFGRYSAEIFCQPILPSIATVLKGSTLDSVVLQLRYDTFGTYGAVNETITLEVYQMAENPAFDEEYYSNDTFLTKPELLGSATFIPSPKEDVYLYGPDDTLKLAPHVRIQLDTAIMNELIMEDSIVFENQDSFLSVFSGIHIVMKGATNTMLGFNLLNSLSGISFYYDKGTVVDQEFKFIITAGSVKTVYMEHDYTGSMVEPALTPDPESDLWYVQGLSGVTTAMKVEGLENLGSAVINQAEMEIYCTFPDGDMGDIYPPCPYIVTQEKTDTTEITNSEDVTIALGLTGNSPNTENFKVFYGGNLTELDPGPPVVYKYTMKVTNQIKDIYEGNKENIIYFNPIAKGNIPNRAVLFGPNHPLYAPKLSVYYTQL